MKKQLKSTTTHSDVTESLLRFLRQHVRAAYMAAPAAFALGFTPIARANTLDWDPTLSGGVTLGGAGTWDTTAASWWDGSLNTQWVNAAGDTARFGGTPGTGAVVIGAGGVSAHGLVFSTGGYTVSGATLTLDDPGSVGVPFITVSNVADTATISSVIAGVNGLAVDGAGTLSLGGVNTYTGGTTITNGKVVATNLAALSTGDVAVSTGGTLQSNLIGTWATNVTLSNGGTFALNAAGQLTMAGGKIITLGTGGGTINVGPSGGAASKVLLAAGQLTGASALTKTGPGVFQIGGAQASFTGTVNINGGTVEFQNVDSLGTAVTTINIDGATSDLTSSGIAVRHNINLTNGGMISANTNANGDFQGTLDVGTGGGTAALRQFQTVTTANSFKVSGPLTGAGNLSVTAPAAATLTLAGNNSAFTGNVIVGSNAAVTINGNQSLIASGYTLAGGVGPARVNVVGANLASPTVGTAGFNGQYFNFGSAEGTAIGVLTGVNNAAPSVKFAQDQLYLTPRVFQRNDAIINIPNSGSGTHPIVPVSGYDYYTVGTSGDNSGGMWKGLLNITTGGNYTFTAASDDNSAIWIDGVLVVNSDTSAGKGISDVNGVANLTSGVHSVVVKWAQGGGGSAAQMSYNGADTGNVKVFLGSVANTVTNGSLAALAIGPISVTSGTGIVDVSSDSEASALTLGTGTTLDTRSITVSNLRISGGTTLGATGVDQSITLAPTTAGLYFDGVISGTGSTGTGALIVAGPYRTVFGNSNTYTGATRVTGGELDLNASGGNAIPGDLTINASNTNGPVANVKLLQSNQIADTANVTLTTGYLDLGANNETVNGLTMNGGFIIGSGTLSTSTVATLNNGWISAGLGGSLGLNKSGTGMVVLSGNNTYTGNTNVTTGGILRVLSNNGLGAAGAVNDVWVDAGASLQLAGALTSEDTTINGDGVSDPFILTGSIRALGGVSSLNSIAVGSSASVRVDSGELRVNTLDLSSGGLTKLGNGTLTFTSNLTSIPAVTFSAGALGFSGPQTFGAATVPAGLAYQFNTDPGAGVTITAPTGTTVIGNYAVDQTFLSRLAAGSTGTLALTSSSNNNLDFSAGPNVSLGATVPVIYGGTITPNAGNYRLGGGAGALNVTSVLNGTNTVEINGRVQLSGFNTFTGNVTVNSGGRLVYATDTNLGTASNVINLNGGTLQWANASDNTGVINFGYLGLPMAASGGGRFISVGAGGGTIDLPARQGGNGGNQLALLTTNQLTGSGALTKTGLGGLYIMSANNFSGSLTLAPNAGRVGLRAIGALANVSSLSLGTATELDVDNTNGLGQRIAQGVYVADRVNNAAPITFLGGSILFTPRGAAAQLAETFGAVTLGSAQSAINANSNPGGSVGAVLSFGALTSNLGSTLRLGGNAGTFGAGTAGAPGANNTQVTFSGLAASSVVGRVSIFGADLAAYDTAVGLKIATYTAQGAAAFTPVAANTYNLNVTGTATLSAGNAEMMGLRFGGGNVAQVLAFNAGAQVLAINSGGIIMDGNNQNRDIGTAAVRGVLTAGPLTGNAVPRELFLHSNNNSLRVFSQITNNNSQAVSVVKDLDGTVLLDATNNNYSGGTFVNRGTLTVTGASGLGSGPVQVRNSRLNLNAAGSTTAATGIYNVIDQGEILLSAAAVTYNGTGDRFTFGPGSTLLGSGAAFAANQNLNSLTRVTAFAGGGQVILQPDSIVSTQLFYNGENGVGNTTVKNLGTSADLYFGLSGNANTQGATLTVGAGTPWKGISTDRNSRSWITGTIFANSDFTLQGLTRDGGQAGLTLGGVNSAGGIAIVNNTSSQIFANINGLVAIGEDTTISIPDTITFVVGSNAMFQPNSSAATGNAKVLVQNGGILDPGIFVQLGAAANQNVNPNGTLNGFQNLPYPVPSPIIGQTTVEAGGKFLINDTSGIGSAPTGTFTLKTNSVLELGSNNAFFGRGDYALNNALTADTTGLAKVDQFTWEPNVVVRVQSEPYKFSLFVPTNDATKAPVIELSGGNRNLTNQNNPFIIPAIGVPTIAPENLVLGNGTMLTTDSFERQLNEGRGRLILNDGAILAATSETYLNIQEGIEAAPNATIYIGSNRWADGTAKLGGVQLTGPNSNVIPNSTTISIVSGAQLAFGAGNVFPDTHALDLPIAVTTFPSGTVTGAQPLQPGNGTSLLLNVANFGEVIGQLTGNGAVIANQGGAFVGVNSATNFTSNVVFKNTNAQQANLWKLGSGTMNYTGVSDSLGQLIVAGGELRYSGTGASQFVENRAVEGGTLTLDNTGTALSNRLGGFLTGGHNLTPGGGTLNLIGNATTPVLESVNTIFNSAGNAGFYSGNPGQTTVKITPGAATTTLLVGAAENFQSAGIQFNRSATILVNSPTVANGSITFSTTAGYTPNAGNSANGLMQIIAPNFGTNGVFGIHSGGLFGSSGTSVAASRPDYLGDANNDGVADGFMTQDGVFQPSANTIGTNVITGLINTANFAVGMPITGTGIPLGSTISSIDSATAIKISNNTSAAATAGVQVIIGGMRNLTSSEYATGFRDNISSGTNVKLSGSVSTSGDTRAQTLTLTPGSTLNLVGTLPNNFTATRLHLNDGGVFVQGGGTATIDGSTSGGSRAFLQANGGTSLFLHTVGDLNLNAAVFSDNAVVKTGAGTLNVGDGAFNVFRGSLQIDGGTVNLGPNNYFANIRGQNGYSSNNNLYLNEGTLNLNGNSIIVNALNNNNEIAGMGGTVTSSSPATLLTMSTGRFSGTIAGAISWYKPTTATQTLTNDNTYTGSTKISAGTLILRDSGKLSGTSSLDINYATLSLENNYLGNVANRIAPTTPVTLRGASFNIVGAAGQVATQTVNSLTLAEGLSSFNSNAGGSGSNEIIIGNLQRANGSGATVVFQQNYGFLGTAGTNTTSIHDFFTNINGAPTALVNNILPSWIVVGSNDFATYNATTGLGALGNTADGYATYDSGDASLATATQNVNDGAARTFATTKTINAWRIAAGAAIIETFNDGVGLTIGSGGIISNAGFTVSFNAAANARNNSITSGTGELHYFVNQNTNGINIPITGNIDFVKSGGGTMNLAASSVITGTVALSNTINMANTAGLEVGDPVTNGTASVFPAGTVITAINPGVSITLNNAATVAGVDFRTTFGNSYAGKTIVNAGTLTLNQIAASPTALAVPGDLLVAGVGSIVTEANVPQQLKTTANITLAAGARFNAVNLANTTETFGSLTFLDGASGTTTTNFDRTALQLASIVNFSAPTAITSTNTNPNTGMPFIGGFAGTIGFTNVGGSTLNITSGNSGVGNAPTVGLRFGARIGNIPTGVAEGGLIKTGNGLLTLDPDQTPIFASTGSTVIGNPVLTGVTSTVGMYPGMQIGGTNIPAGTYIISVDSATQITLSTLPTVAGAVGNITAQGYNQFGLPSTLTDVLNIQSGVVRADRHGSLGSPFANTTVQNGAVLLGSNTSGQIITGSITLKDGATLGATIQGFTLGAPNDVAANVSVLNIPSGNVNIAAYDYYVPATNNGNITINSQVIGSGTINITGTQLTQGNGGGGVIQFGNPLRSGAGAGQTNYSGTINVGTNAILQNQIALVAKNSATAPRATGNALGTATINLAGGRLRVRDDATSGTTAVSNTNVNYGNAITLTENSYLDVGRAANTVDTNSNNTISFGTLTVGAGTKVLTVDSNTGTGVGAGAGNYITNFSSITGAGMLLKGGSGRLQLAAIGGGFTGGLGIAGPSGLALAAVATPNLILPSSATVPNFSVSGLYATEAGKTLNISGTFAINANAGNNAGRVALTNTTTLTAGTFTNDGGIGPAGGSATITSANIGGNGHFLTSLGTDNLTLAGSLTSGTPKFAGANTTTVTGLAHASTGIEVQSGTLRIAPTAAATGSGAIKVIGSASSAASGTTAPIAAVNGTLVFDTGVNTYTHTGNISNAGLVRATTGTTTIAGTIGGTTGYTPGLLEGFTTASGGTLPVDGTRAANPGNFGIQMEPRMLQMNVVTQQALTGHTDNDTWIYTGYVKDNDGVFSFAQNIDDKAAVWIDGVLVLNAANGGTSRVVSSAYKDGQAGTGVLTAGANLGTPSQNFGPGITLSGYGSGWHLIEIRMNNGSGGAGPIVGNGFAVNYGFGYKDGIAALDGADMIKPIDNGMGNLFVTPILTKGNVQVDSASTLKATGITQTNNLTLAADALNSKFEVTGTAASDVDNLITTGTTGKAVLSVSAAAGVLNVNTSVNLAAGTTLSKDGAGTAKLSNSTATAGAGAIVEVTGGTLLLGATNALPATSALNLSSGTTLATGGFSASTGMLTATDAIIDLGANPSGSVLTFTDVGTWSGILSVWNYTGAPWVAGTDKLIFSANIGTINLSNVNFYSDSGVTPMGTTFGATVVGGNELVPVPEPSAIMSLLALFGLAGYKERRRFFHFRK